MASDMNRALKEIEPMVNANLQDIVKRCVSFTTIDEHLLS